MILGARTGALAKSGGGIPSGWVEVEWLKTSGDGAYIDTGLFGESGTRIKVDSFSAVESSGAEIYLGIFERNKFIQVYRNGKYFACGYGNSGYEIYRPAVPLVFGQSYSLELFLGDGDQWMTIDGGDKLRPTSALHGTFTTSATFCIGKNYSFAPYPKIRFGKFEFENSVMRISIVPVRNILTSEGAMCDILTGEIYHNAGTGSFIIGPDKTT